MGDPNILKTLRRKRDEIERVIATYGKKIETARRDLAHVNASIRLFSVDGDSSQFPVYVDTSRLFRRRELVDIAKAALESEGPLDTRELALRAIRVKGMDEGDKVLRQSVGFRLVQALRLQAKRGKIASLGKRSGVTVWEFLSPQADGRLL